MLILDFIFVTILFMNAGDKLGQFFRKEKDWRTGEFGLILFLAGIYFEFILIGLSALPTP